MPTCGHEVAPSQQCSDHPGAVASEGPRLTPSSHSGSGPGEWPSWPPELASHVVPVATPSLVLWNKSCPEAITLVYTLMVKLRPNVCNQQETACSLFPGL